MATTYTLIASSTVGAGGSSSISFTSIPQTYTDLLVVASLRNSGTSDDTLKINFNSSSTSYSARRLMSTGSTLYNSAPTFGDAGQTTFASVTANTFASTNIYIPNYTSSNNKNYNVEATEEWNATTGSLFLIGGFWSNTAAITRIDLLPNADTFAQYSSAYLYGIKNS